MFMFINLHICWIPSRNCSEAAKPAAPSRLVLSLSGQLHFDITTMLGFSSSIAVGNEWDYDFDVVDGHISVVTSAISTTGTDTDIGTGTASSDTVTGNIPGLTTRYWHTARQCWALLSTFSSTSFYASYYSHVLVKILNTSHFFADWNPWPWFARSWGNHH